MHSLLLAQQRVFVVFVIVKKVREIENDRLETFSGHYYSKYTLYVFSTYCRVYHG